MYILPVSCLLKINGKNIKLQFLRTNTLYVLLVVIKLRYLKMCFLDNKKLYKIYHHYLQVFNLN